jgi:hypothetical protein
MLRLKTWVLALFPMVTVLGLLTTGAAVEAEPPRMERTPDGVVGASISHPEGWLVEREA